MARYHINPETGRPNLCSAKFQCRFAVGGQEPEHYDSKDEARAAFEGQMGSEAIPKAAKGDGAERAALLRALNRRPNLAGEPPRWRTMRL